MNRFVKWALSALLVIVAAAVIFSQTMADFWRGLFASSDLNIKPPIINKISAHELQVIGLHTDYASVQMLIPMLTPEIKTLRLSSFGGPVPSAIDLANVILDRDLAVHIDGICMSSCANYIFPAGREVRVLPNGLICAHGTVNSDLRWYTTALSGDTPAREREFFARIGLSPAVLDPDNYPGSDYEFYCPTRDDWQAAGRTNITEFWYPNSQAEMTQLTREDVKKYDPDRLTNGPPIPVLQGEF